MNLSSGQHMADLALGAAQGLGQGLGLRVAGLLLGPGSAASIASLLCAMVVGGLFLLLRRRPGKRAVPVKVLLRALAPRRIFRSRSGRTDLGFLLFNTLAFGLLFGWALVSQAVVSGWLLHGLEAAFGPGPGPLFGETAGPVIALVAGTLALFLAGELGYWVDHWLSHRVPFFWEFHKVHHSAEHLSPLTNFRVHPIEGLKFAWVLALFMGATGAVLTWLLGRPAGAFTVFDRNVIALAGLYLVQHLQHSHLWIRFTGPVGRWIYSPAHHQIHHSNAPEHFDRNFGSLLTLWDRLFGSHYEPPATRPPLTFGLGPGESTHHSLWEGYLAPVGKALATLAPRPAPPLGETAREKAAG
ncbi:MAG: sterol desaturase family protein [Caulobacter sp.]|nr:sterol desaturase family protein [Caulobacter sp.]